MPTDKATVPRQQRGRGDDAMLPKLPGQRAPGADSTARSGHDRRGRPTWRRSTATSWRSTIERTDACVSRLTDDEFVAVASSASRLGASQPRRRLGANIWTAAGHLSPRTKILITYF